MHFLQRKATTETFCGPEKLVEAGQTLLNDRQLNLVRITGGEQVIGQEWDSCLTDANEIGKDMRPNIKKLAKLMPEAVALSAFATTWMESRQEELGRHLVGDTTKPTFAFERLELSSPHKDDAKKAAVTMSIRTDSQTDIERYFYGLRIPGLVDGCISYIDPRNSKLHITNMGNKPNRRWSTMSHVMQMPGDIVLMPADAFHATDATDREGYDTATRALIAGYSSVENEAIRLHQQAGPAQPVRINA